MRLNQQKRNKRERKKISDYSIKHGCVQTVDDLHVSTQTVTKCRREFGVPPFIMVKKIRADWQARREAGEKAFEIAEKEGVTPVYVSRRTHAPIKRVEHKPRKIVAKEYPNASIPMSAILFGSINGFTFPADMDRGEVAA